MIKSFIGTVKKDKASHKIKENHQCGKLHVIVSWGECISTLPQDNGQRTARHWHDQNQAGIYWNIHGLNKTGRSEVDWRVCKCIYQKDHVADRSGGGCEERTQICYKNGIFKWVLNKNISHSSTSAQHWYDCEWIEASHVNWALQQWVRI